MGLPRCHDLGPHRGLTGRVGWGHRVRCRRVGDDGDQRTAGGLEMPPLAGCFFGGSEGGKRCLADVTVSGCPGLALWQLGSS